METIEAKVKPGKKLQPRKNPRILDQANEGMHTRLEKLLLFKNL